MHTTEKLSLNNSTCILAPKHCKNNTMINKSIFVSSANWKQNVLVNYCT